MLVETERFGALEVREEEVFRFTRPVLGFERLREYCLVPLEGNPAFAWLQALADPAVAFLLVDPFLFFAGYQVDLAPELERELEAQRPEDVLVYAIVTLPDDLAAATANLVAPVILSLQARRGCQVVLEGTPYGTRHRLFTRRPQEGQRAAAP